MKTSFRAFVRGAGLGFRLTAFFAAFLVTTWSLHAQANIGSLTGKVRDKMGAALPGAVVTLGNTGLETSTDREGEFYFGNVPEGAHTVHISYLGLAPKDESISVSAGQRQELNVTLGADIIQLQAMTVEGSRSGQAKALNLQRAAESLKEELEMLGPVRLKDVETAQDAIIQVVRRLEEEGQITLESDAAQSLVA